jgi:hypothetical protein
MLAAGALLGAAAVVLAAPARAHRLAPAYLELHEAADGSVAMRFKMPRLRASGSDVTPELPPRCTAGPPRWQDTADARVLHRTLACPGGLVGAELGVRGLAASGTDALVHVSLADGRSFRLLLTAARPTARVPERERPLRVLRAYGGLGLEHLLTGFDHVLFVAGLVLLVRGARRLAGAITSFTLGHSASLAVATLGLARPATSLVEIGIALSLVVVALEVARRDAGRPGALARRPWLLSLGFGLLHGLGFAGALLALGLPQGAVPLALLGFNAGIEAGQLLLVALLAAPLAWLAVGARPRLLAELPATAIGSLGVFMALERATRLL